MVMTILANNDEATTMSQATAVLVQMAALNNLAYIRSETGDLRGSSKRFRMLACIVSRAKSEFTKAILNRRDLEGMMLNVLMANRQSVAPAA